MILLNSGITPENKLTIIILCIAVLVFILIDIALVFSLHRRNRKLAKNKQIVKEQEAEITQDVQSE